MIKFNSYPYPVISNIQTDLNRYYLNDFHLNKPGSIFPIASNIKLSLRLFQIMDDDARESPEISTRVRT